MRDAFDSFDNGFGLTQRPTDNVEQVMSNEQCRTSSAEAVPRMRAPVLVLSGTNVLSSSLWSAASPITIGLARTITFLFTIIDRAACRDLAEAVLQQEAPSGGEIFDSASTC